MKIAIQGHPTRGKEVIQILESLGGKNDCPLTGKKEDFYYYIYNDSRKGIRCHYCDYLGGCKKYTLEEFEKEFPFKIGDKVIHKEYNSLFEIIEFDPENVYPYTIDGVCIFSTKSCVLTKYQLKMKEERNITLTLEKAKEWYKKGGELKEIALQAFTEKELNPLPRNWEEYCKHTSTLTTSFSSCPKYDAFVKLEHLRDCWRQGWKPDWLNGNKQKYAIKGWRDKSSIEVTYVTHAFLSFPTYELALEFQECFKDLIEKARDLI